MSVIVAIEQCTLLDLGFDRPVEQMTGPLRHPGGQAVMLARPAPMVPGSYEIISAGVYLQQRHELRHRPLSQQRIRLKVAELTDEEAFSLAMSEVLREGKYDVRSAAVAIEQAHRRYYKHGFAWMAKRLAVEPSQLKGMVELARLPAEIVHSFPDLNELTSGMVVELSRLVRNPRRRPTVIARASAIAIDQAERARLGLALRPAGEVLDELKAPVSPRARTGLIEIRTPGGVLVALLKTRGAGVGTIEIFNPPGVATNDRITVIKQALHRLDQATEPSDDA